VRDPLDKVTCGISLYGNSIGNFAVSGDHLAEIMATRTLTLRMICAIGLPLLILPLTSSGDSVSAHPHDRLNLQSALKIAEKYAPSLQIARSQEEQAAWITSERKAAFLPSIDLGADWNKSQPEGASGVIISSITQSVFDNGNSITQFQSAKTNERIQAEKLHLAREQVARELIDLFLQTTEIAFQIEIQTEQLQTFERQFHVIDGLFRQGLKTALEQSRIKAQLLRAKSQLIETERLQVRNTNLINEKIGRTPSDLKPTPLDLDRLQRNLESTHPDRLVEPIKNPWYRISQLTREFQELELKLLERERWPKVNLAWSAQYSQNGLFTLTPTDSPGINWKAGLQTTWNVWDFGARHSRVFQAVERNNQALDLIRANIYSLEQRAETLRQEASLVRDIRDIEAEVEATEVKNYQYLESQYREGKMPFLDLVTALRDRADSKTRKLRARIRDLQINIEQYSIEGRLYEWIQSLQL